MKFLLEMIKLRNVFLFASLFLLAPVVIFAQDDKDLLKRPMPPHLVNDEANVIDDASEAQLENKLVNYNDTTSTQIAVITIPSVQPYDVSDYEPQCRREQDSRMLYVRNKRTRILRELAGPVREYPRDAAQDRPWLLPAAYRILPRMVSQAFHCPLGGAYRTHDALLGRQRVLSQRQRLPRVHPRRLPDRNGNRQSGVDSAHGTRVPAPGLSGRPTRVLHVRLGVGWRRLRQPYHMEGHAHRRHRRLARFR